LLAIEKIKKEVESSLRGDFDKYKIKLPEHFKVKLSYKKHVSAFKASFYPGIKQISSTNLVFETDNYFEVLRMLLFAI